jgi:hypothetical protein
VRGGGRTIGKVFQWYRNCSATCNITLNLIMDYLQAMPTIGVIFMYNEILFSIPWVKILPVSFSRSLYAKSFPLKLHLSLNSWISE